MRAGRAGELEQIDAQSPLEVGAKVMRNGSEIELNVRLSQGEPRCIRVSSNGSGADTLLEPCVASRWAVMNIDVREMAKLPNWGQKCHCRTSDAAS